MERRFPDISKVSALTGWVPTRTIEQIVDDTVAFELNRLSL